MVSESQLPHKIVNLLFKLEMANNKLTILWKIDFLEIFNLYILLDKIVQGRRERASTGIYWTVCHTGSLLASDLFGSPHHSVDYEYFTAPEIWA